MKISKFKKKKNNLYEITLSDNTSLSFYDDTILKYELLLTKEIPDDKIKEILSFNQQQEAYYKSLNYINKKLRTKKEINKYLTKYNYSKDDIDYVISRLIENNYLNDEIYIKSYINDQINLTLKGPKKISFELEKLGFNTQDIINYIDSFESDIWLDKINTIMIKKIKSNHKLSSNMLLKKLKQDLVIQGYDIELINNVLSNYYIEEDISIIEKEYYKLYKRLEKKYDKEKLSNMIKYELIKKGFNIDSINNIISQKKIHL